MVTGHVTPAGRAVVPITVGAITLDAVIDTGLDGFVQLPDATASAAPRMYYRTEQFQFADGTKTDFDVYVVGVEFDGQDVVTRAIYTTTGEALIGNKFLTDYRLTIDYPAGTVTLERTRP